MEALHGRGALERQQNAPRADTQNPVCIIGCENEATHFMLDEFHALMEDGPITSLNVGCYVHRTEPGGL